MQENWRDIEGFENIYQVSNCGIVKTKIRQYIRVDGAVYNIKEKPIALSKSKKGYLVVKLCKNYIGKTIPVHRLVAKAFIHNEDALKNQVNHKDGNKENNRVDNLEWVDQTENINHSLYLGLRYTRKVRCIETGQEFISLREAGRVFKSSHKDIARSCNEPKAKCKGHKFVYLT